MKEEIKLGDQVQDLITGFKGIAVARTKWLNGCVRYAIVGKVKPTGNPDENAVEIDEQSIKVLKRGVVPSSEYPKEEEPEEEEITGGPMSIKKRLC